MKTTAIEWLRQTISTLSDDTALAWDRFPCIKWPFGLSHGYGQLSLNGKPTRAHQHSWTIKHGPVPVGMYVMHYCTEQSCFRPSHLYLSTRKEEATKQNLTLNWLRQIVAETANDQNPWNSHPCIEWPFHNKRVGYGRLKTKNHKTESAHRLSWIIANGPIASSRLFVCHHCDRPACVRPIHLFLGTCLDNARDAREKGRYAVGERQGNARLKENQIHEIRTRLLSKESHCSIARVYKVSSSTIWRIAHNLYWKHVKIGRNPALHEAIPMHATDPETA